MDSTKKKAPEPDYDSARASINLKHFIMASLFAAKVDVRHYLMGVRVEPAEIGGVFVLGCDGHTLIVCHDPEGTVTPPDGCRGVVVACPHEAVSAAKMAMRKSALPTRVIVEGRRLSIAPDFGQQHTDLERYVMAGNCHISGDAHFPKWRGVLPNFQELKLGPTGAVNPHYLERVNRAAIVSGPGKYGISVRLWQAGPNSAIAVQFAEHPEVMAMIMPISPSGHGMGEDQPDLFKKLAVLRGHAKQAAPQDATGA